MTPEAREAASNGLWLCQNCARLVDTDVGHYPVSVLRQWKQVAESAALKELQTSGPKASGPPRQGAVVILAVIVVITLLCFYAIARRASNGDVVQALQEVADKGGAVCIGNNRVKYTSTELPIPYQPSSFGPTTAPIKIVVFIDPECPWSLRYMSTIGELGQKYKNKVYFSFRFFLLPMHQNAQSISRIAIAAGVQGNFFSFLSLLRDEGDLCKDSVKMVNVAVARLGLDRDKLNKDADADWVRQRIEEDGRLGESLGVQCTPYSVIQGSIVSGAAAYEAVSEAIDAALSTLR